MGTLFQAEKQAKPVKSVSLSHTPKKRLGSDPVGLFQARCASALRLALPMELKAHGAAMPKVDMDAMAESLARRVAKLADMPTGKREAKAQAQPANDWISTQ